MFTEKYKYYIGIHDSGQIDLRKTRFIMDGDTQVAESHHRTVFNPGDQIDIDIPRLQEIVKLIWTPKIIEEYKNRKQQDILEFKS